MSKVRRPVATFLGYTLLLLLLSHAMSEAPLAPGDHTHDVVRQIAKVLRRTPDIETGVVGEFAWCEE